MKQFILNTLLVFLSLVLSISCNNREQAPESETTSTSTQPQTHPKGQASVSDDVSEKNILQVAATSKDHSTLVAAVQAAGIEHVLVNAGPLTVFAPVNSAFEALPEGTVEHLLKEENKAELATVLTRHAAPGSYDLEALKKESEKGRKLYMATGDYLEVVVSGEEVSVGGANVIATIPTSNGIINVVDKIILPQE